MKLYPVQDTRGLHGAGKGRSCSETTWPLVWYFLRNKAQGDKSTSQVRDSLESAFFREDLPGSASPRERLGATQLKGYLDRLIGDQILRQLDSWVLVAEIDSRISDYQAKPDRL